MGATTKIEWTDATWNPITGCTPCSPGCDHCYAANMVRRFPHLHGLTGPYDDLSPVPFSGVQFHLERLDVPLHWRKPRRVFVCSVGDLFHPDVVMRTDCEWIVAVLNVMRLCPQHTFMLLTKRAGYMMDVMSHLQPQPLPNVWLGVTVCNQAEANAKIPALLRTPAALRFVSIEPMLGPVDLKPWWLNGIRPVQYDDGKPHWVGDGPRINWVICGGETGPGARQMNSAWAMRLRDQCSAAGVPFFFKGHGTWGFFKKTEPNYVRIEGREWHQFPTKGE